MVILGLDPGTSRIGYGIIEKDGHSLKYLTCGVFEINDLEKGKKLERLEKKLTGLIKKSRPQLAVVDSLFFSKNKKTAIAVAEARGVILLTLTKQKVKFMEVTPNEAKLTVSGWGGSGKEAVKKAVFLVLKVKKFKVLDDATDALALAVAGAVRNRIGRVDRI